MHPQVTVRIRGKSESLDLDMAWRQHPAFVYHQSLTTRPECEVLPPLKLNKAGQAVIVPGERFCRFRGPLGDCQYFTLKEDMSALRSHYSLRHGIDTEERKKGTHDGEFGAQLCRWFEELRDGAAPQWMPRKPAVRGYTPDDWEDSPASRVAGSGSNQRRRATLAAGGAGYLLEAAWATPRAEMNPAARPTAPAPEYELHDDYEDDEDEDDAGHDDGDGGDSGDDDAADLRDNLPVKPEAMVRNGPPLKKGWSGACATMHDNLIHEPISLMSLVSQPEAPRDETGKFRIGAMRLYAGMRNGDKCGYCTLRGLRAAATQRTGMGMYACPPQEYHALCGVWERFRKPMAE
ncbi:uncharacterized protein UV8b_05793 [Ustilaginoidea virens]|uniref:Uncharacterized protein n=1 Tax=Ustilaginoidea virens TaxID=1159556 RepID=A0A8E5HTW3_USTVR|nr:uncharacterized protein UV8b_05793 [Ustilaginoidea virens]QUC21550.1 hypothetical protein UV8b_05793 [Ustilaginoidea virens]